MLQKFLDGKKKYSAFIITALATMVPLFIQDPEAQKTIMDFVPSLAAAIAGIFYIVTQGKIDQEKEKVKAAIILNGNGGGAASTTTGITATPAQPQPEIQPFVEPQPESPALSAPLDIKSFHEKVLNDVVAKYSESNPSTVFSMAKDKGSVTTCYDINQAKDYWDYLVTLSFDAEQFVRDATGVDKKDACKVRSPEHVYAQLEVSKTNRCRNYVYDLAHSNIDWKKKLGINNSLYHVGVLAEELLKTC
jgi:hypothetical protein